MRLEGQYTEAEQVVLGPPVELPIFMLFKLWQVLRLRDPSFCSHVPSFLRSRGTITVCLSVCLSVYLSSPSFCSHVHKNQRYICTFGT